VIRIARLTAVELERLHVGIPSWNSTEYVKRLEAQGRGELLQVVAWMEPRPVGRAMVLFPGHDECSESAERESCGEIRDVAVTRDARRLGVATAMIASLEIAVRERGLSRIGLSVAQGDDDEPARALYRKLGYGFAHGPFITSTNLYDDGGRPIRVGAVMSYLTKSLPSP
jgi:GNAT superfamily N-acetyltransferase